MKWFWMPIKFFVRSRGALCAAVALLALAGCNTSGGELATASGAKPTTQRIDSDVATRSNSRQANALNSSVSPSLGSQPGNPGAYEPDYRIGPLDTLEITVFQVKDLDRTVQVSGSGMITLPLIGDVSASRKTVKELQAAIAAKLGAKYLRSPDVHVSVKESTSQRFTIEGSVNQAGVFAMTGNTSLLQGIAMAKGLTRIADTSVVIFRTIDGKREGLRFNLGEIRSGDVRDPLLQTGDVVVVGDSAIRSALQDVMQLVVPAATLVRPY